DGPLTERHLRGVAALLARESGRNDAGPVDAAEIELGIQVFNGDVLDAQGEPVEFAQCLQCHSLKAGDPDGVGNGGMSPAPELDGYASVEWIRAFVREPGAARFYGKKNVMPAFDTERLPDRDLELLVRWMRGEWQGR
ncbi:MAG: cytochrome c, partial [Planctomycetaceae bacterium]